jgi:hypothetical protein
VVPVKQLLLELLRITERFGMHVLVPPLKYDGGAKKKKKKDLQDIQSRELTELIWDRTNQLVILKLSAIIIKYMDTIHIRHSC